MNRKRALVVIGTVVAAVALVWTGAYVWHVLRERALDRADDEGYAIEQAFFRLIGDGNVKPEQREAVKASLAKMQEISTRCREDVKELMLLRRMDGLFLIEDYAGAEKLMDEYEGRSKAWREGAKAKIRAHAAIAKGDKKTAVKELEAFVKMTIAEPNMDFEQDPSTQEEWTREMIVARNYYRMSALAADYDKKAAEGYATEAKAWIEKAKKAAGDDAEMLKTIEKIAGGKL